MSLSLLHDSFIHMKNDALIRLKVFQIPKTMEGYTQITHESVVKEPKVFLRRIPAEELRRFLSQEEGSNITAAPEEAQSEVTAGSSGHEKLLDKIKKLEEELSQKNELIKNLQEEVKRLKAEEKNEKEISNETFNFSGDTLVAPSLEEDINLNISVDRLLQCKAIAKDISNENSLVISKIEEDSAHDKKAKVSQGQSPSTKARKRKQRNDVSNSSVENMSAWLALAKKENLDKSDSDRSNKRKFSDEDLNGTVDNKKKESQILIAAWVEPGLRLKSFASQFAHEANLISN